MDTSDTLFGHLALRFSSHPENLATEALLYLLNKSRDAKGLFAGYLSGHGQDFPPITRFNSQVSSDDNTIPDLVATDMAGNNIFIVENKFWAGLTENQPISYLKQLATYHYSDVSATMEFLLSSELESLAGSERASAGYCR